MKVLYLQLENAAGILNPNITLDLTDSSLISISGANGTGKSFLINNIHPYSNSARSKSVYGIKKGVDGFKHIKYQLDDNSIVDIKHEYVFNPKTNSHNCKSYIDITKDDITTELNPSGNNNTFKDLVSEYLNFHLNTSDLTFLSSSNLGFINNNRKKLIENTYDNKILKLMQKNSDKLLSNSRILLKNYNDKSIQLLKELDINELSEIEEKLDILNKKEDDIKNENNITNVSILNLKSNIRDLENKISTFNIQDIKVCKEYISYFKNPKPNATIDIIQKAYISKYLEYKNLLLVLEKNKNLLTEAKNVLTLVNNKKSLEDKLNEEMVKCEEFKESLNYIIISCDSDIEYKLLLLNRLGFFVQHLTKLLNSNIDFKYFFNLDIDSINNIKNIYNTMDEVFNKSNELKFKYANLIESEVEIDNSLYCKTPNCNMFLHKKNNLDFIQSNEYKVNRINSELLPFNNFLQSTLTHIMETYKIDFKEIQNSFNTHFINDFKLNENEIIQSIMRMDLEKHIEHTINDIKSNKIKYNNCKEIISDLKNKILNINIRQDIDISHIVEYENVVSHLTNDCNNILSMIDVHKYDEINNLFNNINNNLLFISIEEILNSDKTLQDLNISKTNINNDLGNLEFKILTNNNILDNILKQKTLIDNKIKSYNEINLELQKLILEKDTYTSIKDILKINIPLSLTKRVLDSLETTVNNIFSLNDIKIIIKINITENDINIPVIINDTTEVPDISEVSSGESCLIGTLINACLTKLCGYNILCFDEIDANLDIINREKFINIMNACYTILGIDQIFIISHNIAYDLENAKHIVLGNALDVSTLSNVIQIMKGDEVIDVE